MTKTKIRFGIILLVLILFSAAASLPAKEGRFKFFLNVSTGNFSGFLFGGGVEIKVYKSFSFKPSVDFPTNGGRILYFDGVYRPGSKGRMKPYFTFGYFDYSFGGSSRYDSDEVRSFNFGGGVDFYSKKGKYQSSLGIKFGRAEEHSYAIFYLHLALFGF